jgi:hypothetical protein
MLRNKSSTAVRVDEGISSCVRPELSEAELAQTADLRAKAARYRLLAEDLFDPGMVAVENLAEADAHIGTAGERARIQARRSQAAGSQPVNCMTTIVRAMPKTECF